MGRRALRSPDDARALVIGATRSLVATHGYYGISARQIATRVGYSAGALYNFFQDIDEMLWAVEQRHLDGLHDALMHVVNHQTGEAAVRQVAREYLRYALAEPHLWNLVAEHHSGKPPHIPAWYQGKLEDLALCFYQAMASLQMEPRQHMDCAKALWAAVHGIAALSTSAKIPGVGFNDAPALVDHIVTSVLRNACDPAQYQSA